MLLEFMITRNLDKHEEDYHMRAMGAETRGKFINLYRRLNDGGYVEIWACYRELITDEYEVRHVISRYKNVVVDECTRLHADWL